MNFKKNPTKHVPSGRSSDCYTNVTCKSDRNFSCHASSSTVRSKYTHIKKATTWPPFLAMTSLGNLIILALGVKWILAQSMVIGVATPTEVNTAI